MVREAGKSPGLKVKTSIKAGGIQLNHNEALVCIAAKKSRTK